MGNVANGIFEAVTVAKEGAVAEVGVAGRRSVNGVSKAWTEEMMGKSVRRKGFSKHFGMVLNKACVGDRVWEVIDRVTTREK